MMFPAELPERVLAAKTISLVVGWPEGSWQERAQIEADGGAFLRHWKRYELMRELTMETSSRLLWKYSPPSPDLVAVVVVKPIAWRPGASRSFLAALFAGMQAFGAAQPIQTYCSGSETAIGDGIHANVSVDCQTYVPPVEQAPAAQPVWPSYVYGGSILLFDGPQFDNIVSLRREAQDYEADYLHGGHLVDSHGARVADQPLPEPLLVVLAEDRGSEPLLTAAKRLRKALETADARETRLARETAKEHWNRVQTGQEYLCSRVVDSGNMLFCGDGTPGDGTRYIAAPEVLVPRLEYCIRRSEGMRCNDGQLYAGPYVWQDGSDGLRYLQKK